MGGNTIEKEGKVGAVLVIGGGIAGMQSALDLADSGFKVYLLEKSPTIGGAMSQLDKTFPTNDCAMCIMSPKLVETGRHHNIEVITNADLEEVKGSVGNFHVKISKRARYVDEERCTGCGICTLRCPIEVPDEYNRGLKSRKAIYVRYPQAVPPVHSIDRESCIGCGICETQCGAEAIRYSQEKEEIELDIGSIIITPGAKTFDLDVLRSEYGYGEFPNVVSSIEFERMLSSTGPYRGMVLRPSDGEMPQKVAFIQCVGSRDRAKGNPYCSSVCCMFAVKEAVIAQEHIPGLRSHIFFMDVRAFGKEFEEYVIRAEKEFGVRFTKNNRISNIEEVDNNNLLLTYIEEGQLKEEKFDLVVLSTAMSPPQDGKLLSEKIGIDLNEFGFCDTGIFTPTDTNVPGIYVAGTFGGPTDILDTVAQASGVASMSSSNLKSQRHTLTEEREYPEELDVEGQAPRIGVFVCHCGINIGGVVDVPSVVEYAKTLPHVACAEETTYACSHDTQEKIKEKIKDEGLNRVVVASCTPRTHGPLFESTVREAGLSPFLFDMANVREQCSWVHSSEPAKATKKAKDLVKMSVARAALLKALPVDTTEMGQSALVVGGGLSGMTAALSLADQDFSVDLVEKEGALGGNMKRIYYGLGGENLQEFLKGIVDSVTSNERINVHTNAELIQFDGHVGSFTSTIRVNGEEKKLEHGVIIVATGGQELETSEYLLGKSERVLTQLQLNEKLANEGTDAKSVVFIQCVGSRDDERPYCSRICCTNAIKNAIRIKDMSPKTSVYVLFRDMRTYGFREVYYEEAARKGVVFIRYDLDSKPTVTEDGNGNLNVKVLDHFIEEEVTLKPDYLVLSVANVPNEDNRKIAQLLKAPLTKDGFFLEAHMKLRPVDFTNEGMFVCGLAHSPKFLNECVSQAKAAASRAAISLTRGIVDIEAMNAQVDEEKCCGCRTCVKICPFQAIQLTTTDKGLKAEVTAVACKGCGNCAAACPERAITMKHFTDDQLIVESLAALGGNA